MPNVWDGVYLYLDESYYIRMRETAQKRDIYIVNAQAIKRYADALGDSAAFQAVLNQYANPELPAAWLEALQDLATEVDKFNAAVKDAWDKAGILTDGQKKLITSRAINADAILIKKHDASIKEEDVTGERFYLVPIKGADGTITYTLLSEANLEIERRKIASAEKAVAIGEACLIGLIAYETPDIVKKICDAVVHAFIGSYKEGLPGEFV